MRHLFIDLLRLFIDLEKNKKVKQVTYVFEMNQYFELQNISNIYI